MKKRLADRLFPYWFYPWFTVSVALCIVLFFGMLWLLWQFFLIGFYWLVNR